MNKDEIEATGPLYDDNLIPKGLSPLEENPRTKKKEKDTRKDNIGKCHKKLLIGIIIAVVIIVVIISLTIALLVKRSISEKHIRLSNWEGGSESEIGKTGRQITEDVHNKIKNFKKSKNKEWTSVTAMGLIAGDSNDIFFGNNLQEYSPDNFTEPWWFKSKFNLEYKASETVIMTLNGINYHAKEIWIDGQLVQTDDEIRGTFIKHYVDITKYIIKGTRSHIIAFLIKKPDNKYTNHSSNDLSMTFQEISPEPPDSNIGILKPVDIDVYKNKNNIFITDSFLNLNEDLEEGKGWKIDVGFDYYKYTNESLKDFSITFKIEGLATCKGSYTLDQQKGSIHVDSVKCHELNVEDKSKLKRWYPYELGEQNLYNFQISLKNNEVIYNKKIGFRILEAKNGARRREYSINEVKLLIKGGVYIPDLFYRKNNKRLEYELDYLKHMGLNSVRLKGHFMDEDFYDLCDKKGILVFAGLNSNDAWENWDDPKAAEGERVKIATESINNIIRQFQMHPSVISFSLVNKNKLLQSATEWEKYFKNKSQWNGEIISVIDENSHIKIKGPYSWVPSNYFTNEEVLSKQFGADLFQLEGSPGENPLRKGSIEKILSPEELKYPIVGNWNYHCGNEKSRFKSSKWIEDPIKGRFMNDITDFDDFQKKAGLLVYEAYKGMFEAFIIKFDSTSESSVTGVITSYLNSPWPSNYWHLYDYFLHPSPSFYAVKNSIENIHTYYLPDTNQLYLINSSPNNYPKKYLFFNISIYSLKVGIMPARSSSWKDGIKGYSQQILTVQGEKIEDKPYIMNIDVIEENTKLISRNTFFIPESMDVLDENNITEYNIGIKTYSNYSLLNELEKISLDVKVQTSYNSTHGKTTVTLNNRNNVFALNVELILYKNNNDIITPVFWSNNYFGMPPFDTDFKVYAEFPKSEYNKNVKLEVTGFNIENKTITEK